MTNLHARPTRQTKFQFRNGTLDLAERRFWPFEENHLLPKGVASGASAGIFPSETFDPQVLDKPDGWYEFVHGGWATEVATPAIDKILLDQDIPPGSLTYRILLALMGRCLFPLNRPFRIHRVGGGTDWASESLQVMPYIIGRGGTGKSTLVDMVRYLYTDGEKRETPGVVGTLNVNPEDSFPLMSLVNCHVVIGSEIYDKFTLEMGLLLNMITGETVSIQIKNKAAIPDFVWDKPMAFAGNTHFFRSGNNSEGQLSRRFGIVEFKKPPSDVPLPGDDNIETRMRIKERAPNLLKLWFAYTSLVALQRHRRWPRDADLISRLERTEGQAPYFGMTALNAMPLYQVIRRFVESDKVMREDPEARFVPLRDIVEEPQGPQRIDNFFPAAAPPQLVDKYQHSRAQRADTAFRVEVSDLKAAMVHFSRDDFRYHFRFQEAVRIFDYFQIWPADIGGHSEGPGHPSYFYGLRIHEDFLAEARNARK